SPWRRLRCRRSVVGKRPSGRGARHVTRLVPAIGSAALGAALALAACNPNPTSPAKPLVITSFYPLYEFTRQVADPLARVVSLVPTGVEPHDWEPSPQDLARLREAQLFVYHGAGLDPWVSKLLADPGSPRPLVVRATEGIPLLTRAPLSDGAGPGQPFPDPDVWLDPVLAASMVETIRAGLAKVDPEHPALYAPTARRFIAELEALHEKFRTGLEHCAGREIVTSHAAFAYLARRYHLTLMSVMGVVPESEPTPAQLASVVRFARDKKVKYIFVETLVSPGLALTLAREVG